MFSVAIERVHWHQQKLGKFQMYLKRNDINEKCRRKTIFLKTFNQNFFVKSYTEQYPLIIFLMKKICFVFIPIASEMFAP